MTGILDVESPVQDLHTGQLLAKSPTPPVDVGGVDHIGERLHRFFERRSWIEGSPAALAARSARPIPAHVGHWRFTWTAPF